MDILLTFNHQRLYIVIFPVKQRKLRENILHKNQRYILLGFCDLLPYLFNFFYLFIFKSLINCKYIEMEESYVSKTLKCKKILTLSISSV